MSVHIYISKSSFCYVSISVTSGLNVYVYFPVFILLCIYFPFFNLCVCISQSCLYVSVFPHLHSTMHMFPSLHATSVFLNLRSTSLYLSIFSLCVPVFEFPSLACMSLNFPSSFYHAHAPQSSIYMSVFLSPRSTILYFPVISLYVSAFVQISQPCLYDSVFPHLHSTLHISHCSIYVSVFLSPSSTWLHYPIFSLYMSVFVLISQPCLYASVFPRLHSTILIFPTLQAMCLYFQILSLHVHISQFQPTCASASQSSVYMCLSLNLVFTCLDIQLLVLLHLYFTFFNICGCVSKFSLHA
jgi:hypothetical protein